MVDVNMTLWSPDTCGCSIFYSWDKDLPVAERVHAYVPSTQVQSVADSISASQGRSSKPQPNAKICPAHLALGHTDALYAVVREENTRKNITVSIALDTTADRLVHSDVRWSFPDGAPRVSGARVLAIRFNKLVTGIEKMDIQAACDLTFGPGRIEFS